MLFKDQAGALVAKWENIRSASDLHVLASYTAVMLSNVENVPDEVLEHLDAIMGLRFKKLGRATYEVVKYLRSLCEERKPKIEDRPLILKV